MGNGYVRDMGYRMDTGMDATRVWTGHLYGRDTGMEGTRYVRDTSMEGTRVCKGHGV